MTLPNYVSSKRGIKLMSFLSNFGKFTAIIGGILWLNGVNGALYVVSAGALLVACYYLLACFIQPTEKLDWTLVHPELAGADSDE